MMGEVVPLHEILATCPECNCQSWFIHVDNFSDWYEKVNKFECVECGFCVYINVEVVKVEC